MADQAGADRREEIRAGYAAAARAVMDPKPDSSVSCCSTSAAGSCCDSGSAAVEIADGFGASLYGKDTDGLPEEAVLASLGCGNPLAVADLHEGERVLDLGSGGGIDVLLSARRVGPTGFAYGLDMTDDMLALARANAAKAGAANVEFLKGEIEAIPLPGGSVDVVISNCVINLSTDKPAVLAEMFRVLAPGGRIGISDVVAEDRMSPADRAAAGSYVGCIAGALSRTEYLDGLRAAGFSDPEVTFTHEVAPGMQSAIIRAAKPENTRKPEHTGQTRQREITDPRRASSMIQVFEGPLCCNTGVCGTDPDQALVDFTTDVKWLTRQGVEVRRANLAQDPGTFAESAIARAYVQKVGAEGLPLVVADDVTVATGRYPSRAELARIAGIEAPEAGNEAQAETTAEVPPGACCADGASSSGCCDSTQTLSIQSRPGGQTV